MTTTDSITKLPDSTRLWIYGFERILTVKEIGVVRSTFSDFIKGWNSHGSAISGGIALEYDIFAILYVDSIDGISGCSIDSSVRVFKGLKERYGLDAMNQTGVYFRSGDSIKVVDRPVFQQLIHAGKITEDTIVFNNTVQSVGDFKNGQWETQLKNSWHKDAFDMTVT